MRVVALISGGKDSCFNMMHCIALGHEIVALANLKPAKVDEIDSYMFQTVGHHAIDLYAEALNLPLYRSLIKGESLNIGANYQVVKGDEVEDLYDLLRDIQKEIQFDAVSSGAILSDYQRKRVENVASRLGLQSLAYLWQRDQIELLDEMINNGVHAILIKTASLGLIPKNHLGKSLSEMQSQLLKMKNDFQLNVCGEGGEYETLTLDCPLFVKKIVIDESVMIMHSDDACAQVGYLSFTKMHLEDKGLQSSLPLKDRLTNLTKPLLPSMKHLKKLKFSKILLNEELSNPSVITSGIDSRLEEEMTLLNDFNKTWISGIVCHREDDLSLENSVQNTFEKVFTAIGDKYKSEDITLVHLFCADLSEFHLINLVYANFFNFNPPSRVCIESILPKDVLFKMDILIDKAGIRTNLHVQSISYWAPSNIGPYSQCVRVGETIYFSGSIGMVPSTMEVLDSDFVHEAYLALYHVKTVCNGILHRNDYESLGRGNITCYITKKHIFSYVEEFFKFQNLFNSKDYTLDIICVSRLPRNANIEWHVQSTDETFSSQTPSHIDSGSDNDDDDSGNRIDEGGNSVLKINNNYSVAIPNDIMSSSTLVLEYIKEHVEYFWCCRFIRLYYVSESHDVNLLKNVLSNEILYRDFKKPVMSFVPVRALLPGYGLLIQISCFRE